MFRRILIANRGEIALRIARTLREMDICAVALYSDADRDAPFVREADEAYRVGPPPAAQSYLDIGAILSVASQAGVDAVHPGYGFLAENAAFASAVAEAGLTFIGPPVEAIRLMGDKVEARRAVEALGVPVIPGTKGPVSSVEQAHAFARDAGFPVVIKAAGGGGGRGIRVVQDAAAMRDALDGARREAQAYFKRPEVYLERYFEDPRHVEIQVLADGHGTVVSLGERDCSVQRRHQKLIEETPSPALNRTLRRQMSEAAVRAAGAAQYRSAGTVEFLLTRDGEFYFLEMNTRIQVEHPVTEMVTGLDLIREMVLAAAGERITASESLLDLHGHSIEVRVNAEDPLDNFRPTPARIDRYRLPGGIGVRIDSGVEEGFTIPQEYDSLMAKTVVWAPDRERARRRMLRALDEFEIAGPATTLPFARAVIDHPTFAAGDAGTRFVEHRMGELTDALKGTPVTSAGAAGSERTEPRSFEVEVNRKLFRVQVTELRTPQRDRVDRSPRRHHRVSAPSGNAVLSPMHGTVVDVKIGAGQRVEEGQTLLVIEAMKMENEIVSHRRGMVSSVDVAVGDTVELDQPLVVVD